MAKSVKEGWRNFKSHHIFKRKKGDNDIRRSMSCDDLEVLCMAPVVQHSSGARSGITRKLWWSSKSLPNLEAIMSSVVASLKEKYYLRRELRRGNPATEYSIQLWDTDGRQLWDDCDDPTEAMYRLMLRIGLY